MSRLIVESGNEAGMVYPLRLDFITIGRSASADIQIADKRISRHHIVLRRTRDGYVVEDLGSKNGSFLNRDPLVGRAKLATGDEIHIGETVLLYECEPDEQMLGADGTKPGGVKLVADDIAGSKVEQVSIDTTPALGVTRPVVREILKDPFERLKILYQVADSLRSELEIEDLLTKIMDFLWNAISPHRGIILLKDEREDTLDPVVVRLREGNVEEVNISSSVVQRAMEDQVAILIADAPSDLRFSASDSIISSRVRSAICVPLVCKRQVLGVIYLDSQEPGKINYTNDELELVTGIANQAALAIVTARLYKQALERQKLERELEIARSIQVNLLPKVYPDVPGATFSALSTPARKVGGDYYDFIPLEDGLIGIVVADVSGKGVPAALLAATVRASLRVEVTQNVRPSACSILSSVNRWACRDATNNMFVTMVYAIYDPRNRTLEYVNAGHCFPMLFKSSGEYFALETGGCFLGIMEQVEYQSETIKLAPGDTLVLYTDGLIDTHNSDKQLFGLEKVVEIVRANLNASAEELRDELYEATLNFRGSTEQFDDLTLLITKF